MNGNIDTQALHVRDGLNEQKEQQPLLWQPLTSPRSPVDLRACAAPQGEPTGKGSQVHGSAERWEQVPIGVRLMNEVRDALSIGSDFAFWSGLIIIFVALVPLIIWW